MRPISAFSRCSHRKHGTSVGTPCLHAHTHCALTPPPLVPLVPSLASHALQALKTADQGEGCKSLRKAPTGTEVPEDGPSRGWSPRAPSPSAVLRDQAQQEGKKPRRPKSGFLGHPWLPVPQGRPEPYRPLPHHRRARTVTHLIAAVPFSSSSLHFLSTMRRKSIRFSDPLREPAPRSLSGAAEGSGGSNCAARGKGGS